MSELSRKRKRTQQDSMADSSKVRKELSSRLESLQDELDGVESEGRAWNEEIFQTTGTLLDRIAALKKKFKGPKRPKKTTTITEEDLEKAGVEKKDLDFNPTKLAELANEMSPNAKAEIADLHSRIKKIYGNVNVDCGSRMVLDAVLLASAEILSTQTRGVAIFPEMRVAPDEDEVQIVNPASGYELCLSDNQVDYLVIEYENPKLKHYAKSRLLTLGDTGREDAILCANGRLFILVEAKCQMGPEQTIASRIPGAIGQAIALMMSAKLPEVRLCVSDGEYWVFLILKLENGDLAYFQSTREHLTRAVFDKSNSDSEVGKIVLLICEWLHPTATDLYELT